MLNISGSQVASASNTLDRSNCQILPRRPSLLPPTGTTVASLQLHNPLAISARNNIELDQRILPREIEWVDCQFSLGMEWMRKNDTPDIWLRIAEPSTLCLHEDIIGVAQKDRWVSHLESSSMPGFPARIVSARLHRTQGNHSFVVRQGSLGAAADGCKCRICISNSASIIQSTYPTSSDRHSIVTLCETFHRS
jgi:hypothetical protein